MKAFEQPLSEREEKEMIKKTQNGDMKARNILVEKNMRLVAHMIKKYMSADRDTDDLISVGTIGLIKAVNTFNPDKKIRLATYAAKCIDNELLMMLRNDRKKLMELSLSEPIGRDEERDDVAQLLLEEQLNCIKTHMKDVLNKREIYIICGRYGLGGGKEKTQNELADKLGISRSYVSRIEQKALEKLYNLLGSYRLL